MITLEQYLMGRHLLYPKEYNKTLELNAKGLLVMVNDFFYQLGIDPELSSGFRPPSVNKNVKGAAKGSKHTTCQAIDIKDPGQKIAKLICGDDFKDHVLLEEFNLYMEHPSYTKTWVHLQNVPTKSGKRIFIPY